MLLLIIIVLLFYYSFGASVNYYFFFCITPFMASFYLFFYIIYSFWDERDYFFCITTCSNFPFETSASEPRCHRGLSPTRIVSGGQNPLADSVRADVIC